jgi:YD repeat-containing protein
LIKTVPSLNERIGLNFPDDYPNQKIKRQINPGWTNNLYLASIETSNEKVLFDLENRSDMPDGARRLKTIKVFDKLLGKRIINDSLSYDYFTGTDIGGDYTTDDNYKGNAVADDLLRKRLKLTKLTRFDANAAKGEEYTFAYNESVNLPLKSSFARDYWGYYNGQENASQLIPNGAQHTLIPKLRDIVLPGSYPDIPEEFWKFSGANRGASAGNITAWMLQSIRYPTGGRTEFQFEPHAFSNQTYLSAEDRNQLYTTPVPIPSVFYNNPTASQQYKSQPFTLNARTLIHLEGTINGNISGQYLTLDQLLGTYIAIYNPTGPQAITYQLTTSDYDTFTTYHLKIWKTDFYLDAGSYVLTCGVPSTLGYQGYTDIVSASLNYENYHPEVLANAKPIGGGVRVQSITNYDENNKVVLTKNYTYKGGKMLTPLQMLENRWVHGITQTHVYTLSSDSYNPPASAYCGTNVGYDKVEITNLAGSNTNGKEIDSLRNNPGTQIFSGCNFYDYDCSNGDVLKRVYLNSASDTVKVEKMTYAASDLYNEAINFVFEDNFLYNGAAFCGFQDPCRYNIFVFPNKGLWSYLQRQETTDYVQGNKISKTTEFIYNITNYCIKEYKETNSDQKTKITHYTYPVDYSSMPYSTMAGFNITNPVIEQSEYIGSDFLQSTLTSYRNWSNAVFKPDTIRTKTKTSNYEPRIEYDKYDNKGNFLQFHKDNDVITSFVWGYNQTYPVVKAENVDHASLNSAVTLVQTDLQGFLTNSIKDLTTDAQKSAWKSFNASLRDALPPNVVVTTYTYAPLIGMTSSTDPNGFTTYYEYDTFGRLKLIRDKDNKILKQYHYHYQSQQ